jgi:hypothetical protein
VGAQAFGELLTGKRRIRKSNQDQDKKQFGQDVKKDSEAKYYKAGGGSAGLFS